MRKTVTIILLVLFGANSEGLGQKIIIKGEFSTPPINNTPITVLNSIDGFDNDFYSESTDDTNIIDGKFNIQVTHSKAGIIHLKSKGLSSTYFYAEPNDTISIEFKEDTLTGKTIPFYSGNNAAANNLIAQKQLYNNSKVSQDLFIAIIKDADSADDALLKINNELNPKIQLLQRFYDNKVITNECFNAFVASLQQRTLFWCNTFGSDKPPVVTKMSKGESDKLIIKLNTIYDPFKPENRIGLTNYSNCYRKSFFMMNKIIDSPAPKSQIWGKYDEQFSGVVDKIGVIDFAPLDVQKHFMGNSVLTAIAFDAIKKVDLKEIYNTYSTMFPKSLYLPMIQKHLSDNTIQTNENKVDYKVYFKDSLSSLHESDNFMGVDTVRTIESLIKNYFGGKTVFVDFWATWCSPCIAEFKYEKELHEFLEKNNIQILYASVDEIKAKGVWEKLVNKYKINGYHYLINPTVAQNLNKLVQSIPKYVLFGPDGKILNDDLLRPSKRKILYSQIQKLVKK